MSEAKTGTETKRKNRSRSGADSDRTPRAGDAASGGAPTRALSDDDRYLFNEGNHLHLYDKLGAHLVERDGEAGVVFRVWAPNAEAVSVIGDFNDWDRGSHRLVPAGSSGIWQGFVPGIGKGERYKYHIVSRHNGYRVDKADPYGFLHEEPPRTASVVWDLDYEWGDAEWMRTRGERNALDAPFSIYEVHLGSWLRRDTWRPDGDAIVPPVPGPEPGAELASTAEAAPTGEVAGTDAGEGSSEFLSYREIARPLADYAERMGFTHVELLPIMEHPFYGSWGYQTTGYFAPSARYGTPQGLMHLIDVLHQRGIGVILDWVPSHFPTDEHGLGYFDGTHLFEHQDPRQGYHPDWKSLIFNYGRNEVRSFLKSSANFWLDRYHVDGLRVDAVASMLYLDYSREEGEWIPNEYGGRENIQAIRFLRELNTAIYENHDGVQVMAEESTAWPMVSRPTYVGGLGFGMKWDMGWMHDTLVYFSKDPVHRRYHHDQLTFRMVYAFTENFALPLSHDEVVHGKGSLLNKMPGDDWQKFANLRLLYAYMYAQPGKKLLFMGADMAQRDEWDHDESLQWHLLQHDAHAGAQRLLADLNRLYRRLPALHACDFSADGFEWIDANDSANSVLSFLRKDGDDVLLGVFSFTPVPRQAYRVGVPRGGRWEELLNTDAEGYGGSGVGNLGGVEAEDAPFHGRSHSVTLTLPPLGAIWLRPAGSSGPA